MKKLISMILVLAMIMGLAMPVFATTSVIIPGIGGITGGTVTGDTEGDVYATFTPEIAITGMAVIGDTVVYDAETNTYTVYFPADGTNVDYCLEISGRNLKYYQSAENLAMKSRTTIQDNEITSEMLLNKWPVHYQDQDGKLILKSSTNCVGMPDGIYDEYKYSNDGMLNWQYGIEMVYRIAYDATVAETENGSVTMDNEFAGEGDTVNLIVTPEDGYELDELIVKDAEGNPVEVTDNTFTMPAGGVTITATFKEIVVYYNVYMGLTANGTVETDKAVAAAGETVTLTVKPDEHYELDTLTVNEGDVTVVAGEDGTYTFAMPEGDASVKAKFKKITYAITIDENIANGAVTADMETAAYGDTVTLTVSADTKYELESLTVTDAEGNDVTVNADNTFTMPASNVTVTATFEAMIITSANIAWGSMDFTYTLENGWANDGSDQAGTVTVTNTGDTTFTASVEYNQEEDYTEITGSFDAASAELVSAADKTFTLTLSGEPAKVIVGGTKIGTVTVTMSNEAITPNPPASGDGITTAAALKSALEAGGNIKLGSNITLEEYVNIENPTTLDLNGKTLTLQGDEGHLYVDWSSLTLKNGTIQTDTYVAVRAYYGCSLTIDNCTIQSSDYYAIYLVDGTAVVTNSSLLGGINLGSSYGSSVLTAVDNVTITNIDGNYLSGLCVESGCSATVGFDPTGILSPYYNKGTVTDNGDGTWTVA